MAVTNTGEWIEEQDYETYPKEKWCAFDTMAYWIRELGYAPKTNMKNLILNIFCLAEDHFENENIIDYSCEDIKGFVLESGGLKEFDFVS